MRTHSDLRVFIFSYVAPFLILLTFLLSGCSAFRGPEPWKDVGPLGLEKFTAIRTPVHFSYAEDSKADPDKHPYFQTAYDKAPNAAEKRAVRNAIVEELLSIVDQEYELYEQQVRGDRAIKDTSVGIISLALTGAASIDKGVSTLFAAIDTGLKGSNQTFDANVFQNEAVNTLLSQMQADRASIDGDITTRLKQDTTTYPLEEALRDVAHYYAAGSISAAMVSLQKNSAAAQSDNQKSTKNAKNAGNSAATPAIIGPTADTAALNAAYTKGVIASFTPVSGYTATGLPPGLKIDSSTGVISGTPTSVGVYTVVLGVTNKSETATSKFELTVLSAGVPLFSSANTAPGTKGAAFNFTLKASNSPSYSSTKLPDGLSLDATTGVISGTPTSTGTTDVTVTATNAAGTTSMDISIVIGS